MKVLNHFAWGAAAVIFVSAFLLFQVQPLISKIILPWFGGSPAVWTTAMLFFQVVLLAGYAYAHLVMRWRSRGGQLFVHVLLLFTATLTLPIQPHESWKPRGEGDPALRILALLTVTVGLPYFLLSSTGPLVQAWFARVYPGRSPYRLYALSNVGSLAALLTFPFVFEPALSSPAQARLWSIGFMGFALASATLAAVALRDRPAANIPFRDAPHDDAEAGSTAAAAVWRQKLAWILLPALAVVILLSVTNRLCRDVAVVPFLWVAPLTLYLLTFIITFDHQRWYVRPLHASLAALAAVAVALSMSGQWVDHVLGSIGLDLDLNRWLSDLYVESALDLAWLLLGCMVCHGELYRLKPPPRQLTAYYLSISAGGALGGLLVALVCPLVFPNYWEWPISVVAGYLLAVGVLAREAQHRGSSAGWLTGRRALVLAAPGLVLIIGLLSLPEKRNVVARMRNFYGVLTVEKLYEDRPHQAGYGLLNGRILHGFQYTSPSMRHLPTTYYAHGSAPAWVTEVLREQARPLRFGFIGLGTGSLAAYGRRGDYVCFYEMDPNVAALQGRYFTFLDDCRATVELVLGDARIRMERQEPQNFDFLVVDAFSSDAIPAHLLTREALTLYLSHLRPDGVLAFHTSNRYVDLLPVLKALAKTAGLRMYWFQNKTSYGAVNFSSEYVVMTRDPTFGSHPLVQQHAMAVEPIGKMILWTDQYSNLFDVLY